MNGFLSGFDLHKRLFCVAGGVTAVAVSVVIVKKLWPRKKTTYPRDTVILHQIGRGPYAPSLSPYIVKLETYLRMAKIPYQVSHGMTPSPKGKWPWIEYNGEVVADSELCIDFLNKKFSINLNNHLTPFERAVALTARITMEEHAILCHAMFRYVYDPEVAVIRKAFNIGKLLLWIYKRKARAALYTAGIGRHTKEEVALFLERDLQAVSDILGQKKFLMGDKPCEADCAVFGQLSQLHWHAVGNELETILKDKFPSLAAYCERVKAAYWPDWDDCTTRGFTAKATK
ncbi:failed axon connections homolog [Haliotis rufescens]|uniref:failed axon connections homolog n=1 Tax=Haliotis rufescens TaxID=6454 RepID=UPI00201F669C|nr:failed axon connections homolog [Haliotis rufescens]